jgi:O-6-methylguanine DNA methyltransferase
MKAFSLALDEYFAGNLASMDAFKTVPQRGTPFQREVWKELAHIPPFRHQTYAGIAACVGRPKAVRAAGSAIGKNPLFLVLPCHRVLGKDGALRGFACGLDVKRWLLQHEARHLTQALV